MATTFCYNTRSRAPNDSTKTKTDIQIALQVNVEHVICYSTLYTDVPSFKALSLPSMSGRLS